MVGADQDTEIALVLKRLVKRAHDVTVDLLQRLHLGLAIPFVRGFVGGLHMHANNVGVIQGIDGVTPLGGVIGVGIAGGARDFDPLPTQQGRESAEQIHGGNHGPPQPVYICKRLQPGRASLTP